MKGKICCFIGDSKIPFEDYENISERVREETVKLIKKGYKNFCTGAETGFDILVALNIFRLRLEHPEIRLILVLPYRYKAKTGQRNDREIYTEIRVRNFNIEDADYVKYTSDNHNRGCIFKRNQYLADNSSTCVCYQRYEKGGIAYAVKYAKRQGVDVINIANVI